MWTYVLVDFEGKDIGEVQNASERNLLLAMNRPSTASFTIRGDHELMVPLFSDDTYLQVWDDNQVLRFYGNVVSTEWATQDTGEQPTIKVNAANPIWRLSRRVLGISAGGTAFSGDKAKMAWKMINELNTNVVAYPTNPDTKIKLNAEATYSAGSTGSYVAGPYKSALTCINDVAHGLDGFDWYVSPIAEEWPKIGLFEASGTFGKSSSVILEHGYGQRNVKQLTYLRDLSNITNKAYHLPDEGVGAEGAEVKNASNVPSLEHRGRFEEVTDAFGIVDGTLRQNWVDEVVRVKANPRFVVSMTLDTDDGTGRVPTLGTDYWLGDTAQARSVVGNTTMFNGKVRIFQINVAVNNNGTALITPILIDEEGGELAA